MRSRAVEPRQHRALAERLRHQLGSEDPAAWLPEFMARFREAVD